MNESIKPDMRCRSQAVCEAAGRLVCVCVRERERVSSVMGMMVLVV